MALLKTSHDHNSFRMASWIKANKTRLHPNLFSTTSRPTSKAVSEQRADNREHRFIKCSLICRRSEAVRLLMR